MRKSTLLAFLFLPFMVQAQAGLSEATVPLTPSSFRTTRETATEKTLRLAQPVSIDGIIKRITLDTYLPVVNTESLAVAPLFLSGYGLELRLPWQSVRPEEDQRSWTAPNCVTLFSSTGTPSSTLVGFRLTGIARDIDLVEIKQVSYITDTFSREARDPDSMDPETQPLARGRVAGASEREPPLPQPPVRYRTSPRLPESSLDIGLYLDYFKPSPRIITTPGFQLLKGVLLQNMWAQNPRRTLTFLQSWGDSLWQHYLPSEVFDVIGYDFVPDFDNALFQILEDENAPGVAPVLALASFYAPRPRTNPRRHPSHCLHPGTTRQDNRDRHL